MHLKEPLQIVNQQIHPPPRFASNLEQSPASAPGTPPILPLSTFEFLSSLRLPDNIGNTTKNNTNHSNKNNNNNNQNDNNTITTTEEGEQTLVLPIDLSEEYSSESDSDSSDRVHHHSLSSEDSACSDVISQSCSLASLDVDESDFESYCSFEAEFQSDLRLIRSHCDYGSGYESLESQSRPSSEINKVFQESNNFKNQSHSETNDNLNQFDDKSCVLKNYYTKQKVSSLVEFPESNPSTTSGFAAESSSSEFIIFSDEDNSSDIEYKLAETITKMSDAMLSNGREEIEFQNGKSKKLQLANNLKENEDFEQEKESNISETEKEVTLNNNLINFKNQQIKNELNLKLKDEEENNANYFTPIPESPILDAYEKEGLGVPEKMVISSKIESSDAMHVEKEIIIDTNIQNNETAETKEVTQSSTIESPIDELENNEKEIPRHRQERFNIIRHFMSKKNGEEKDDDSNSEADDDSLKIIKEPKKSSKSSKSAFSRYSGKCKPHRVSFTIADESRIRRHGSRKDRATFRRSVPQIGSSQGQRSMPTSPEFGEFDVYNMETAWPKADWPNADTQSLTNMERRRNDREEIRRKLAMGVDDEFVMDRPGKKPSLQSRLQSGMNLQICFMNETASDCESQCSDTESTQGRPEDDHLAKMMDPDDAETAGFFNQQAQLQAEARMALAQAKEMARMQMEIERQSKKKSPIADIVRESFFKVGFPFPDKRRMSRLILTDMNVAQLQVIVNDFHTQIECLNEELVKYLLQRDDLHMEQDSMLVDIEDLTKHLSAKEKIYRSQKDITPDEPTSCLASSKQKALVLK